MLHAKNGKEAHGGLTPGLQAARGGNARRACLTRISGWFHKGQACVSHSSVQLSLPRQRQRSPCENLIVSRCVPGAASQLKSRFGRSVYVSLLPNNFAMTRSSSLSSAQKPHRLPIAVRANSRLERDAFEVLRSFDPHLPHPSLPLPQGPPSTIRYCWLVINFSCHKGLRKRVNHFR